MTTGADVAAEAREWLGTRWQHQACLKGVACDCIGLIGGVAAATGVDDVWVRPEGIALRTYGPLPVSSDLLEGCYRFLDPVPYGQWQLGDVLVLRLQKDPQHFAILSNLDPMRMIHCMAQFPRKVTEQGIDAEIRSRIVKVFRLRGLQ